MPLSEKSVLSQIRGEAFLSYASSQEIPANVRAALNRAVELRRLADADAAARQELEDQRNRLVSDQDRIRRNLEAAGNQSSQGQEYLKRLAALDAGIDALDARIEEAAKKSAASARAVEDYLASLSIP
jgi:chromosome segregation ATPase